MEVIDGETITSGVVCEGSLVLTQMRLLYAAMLIAGIVASIIAGDAFLRVKNDNQATQE